MESPTHRAVDQSMLNALRAYVAGRHHPDFAPFLDRMSNCGDEWVNVGTRHLPASDTLAAAAQSVVPSARDLVSTFVSLRHRCLWRQTYTKSDGLVGDDMLASYGYVEVIGPAGPFVSDEVRGGLGLFGPNVSYPPHRHGWAEIYDIVAGAATFFIGEESERIGPRRYGAGEYVFMPPNVRHGYATGDIPFIVVYLAAGDGLAAKPSFD